jgi:hypothetical protein
MTTILILQSSYLQPPYYGTIIDRLKRIILYNTKGTPTTFPGITVIYTYIDFFISLAHYGF